MPGPLPKVKKEKAGKLEPNVSKRGGKKKAAVAPPEKPAPGPSQLIAQEPLKPSWLDAEASQHWDYLVSMLLPKGLLTDLDGPALTIMCAAWSRGIRAEEKIQTNLCIKVTGGGERVSGFIKIAKDSWASYYNYLEKFGMTPQARAKMHMDLPKRNGSNQQKKTDFDYER